MDARYIAMTVVVALSALCMSARAEEFELPLTDDALINGNAATTNFGAAPSLSVHNYGPKFSLVRFDAATIAGKDVKQATLVVYVRSLGSAGELTVYPVASSWNENTVTWARQPPTEAAAAADVTLTDAMASVEIDVTSVVQRWADGTLPDAGFLLTTVDPIKAVLDSKERDPATANPASLTVYTSADTGPQTLVLDLSKSANCSIDSPGYYVFDRNWLFSPDGGVEGNAACNTGVHITSGGVTLDLQEFAISSGQSWGNYAPVLWIDTTSGVTLRNGALRGIFVAMQSSASAAGGTVTLENIRAGGSVSLGNRNVAVIGGSYSGMWETSLTVGGGSRVERARLTCNEEACLQAGGKSLIRDNVFAGGDYDSRAPSLAVSGDDTIVEGNAFDRWVYIDGNRNIVSRNFSGGGYIEVHGAGNIIDGNIGPGIAFEATGNFYGNNRAHGAFTGVAGNVDWGGNVNY